MAETEVPEIVETFRWLNENSNPKYNLTKSNFPFPHYLNLHAQDFFDFLNSDIDGEEELIGALSRKYSTDEENILPTVGGTESIYIGIMSLRSRKILLHVPEYEPFIRVARLAEKEIILKDITGDESSGQITDSSYAAAFTSPNNPLGILADLKNYRSFKEIFVDETFANYSAMDELPLNDFNITVSGTMSKLFGASETRVGWLISSPSNVERYSRLRDLTTNKTSEYSMYISSLILNHEKEIRERNIATIKENMKTVSDFLGENDLSAALSGETAFCFPKYEMKVDSVTLCRKILDDSGVLVVPGKFFGMEKHFRLCFTSDNKTLMEALTALSESLKRMRRIY